MVETTLHRAGPRFSQAPRFQAMLDELGLHHEPNMGGVAFREQSARGELAGRFDPLLRRNRERERTELLGVRLTLRAPLDSGGRLVLAERRLTSRLTRWLNRYGGLRALPVPRGLEHLEAWAHEPQWAMALLGNAELAAQVGELLPSDDAARHAALHWHPDHLLFSAMHSQNQILHRFREWRLRMHALAEHARDLPGPEKSHSPRWIETRPRLVVVAGGLGLVVAAMVLLGAAIALSHLLL